MAGLTIGEGRTAGFTHLLSRWRDRGGVVGGWGRGGGGGGECEVETGRKTYIYIWHSDGQTET